MKKFLSLSVLLAIVLTLASCGKTSHKGTAGTNENPAPQVPAEPVTIWLISGKAFLSPSGIVIEHTERTYNDHGDPIKQVFYHYEECLEEIRYSYEYDDRGNIIKKYQYFDGVLTSCSGFAYDSENHLTAEYSIHDDGQITPHNSYVYQNDKLVEETYYSEGEIYLRNLYSYDMKGKIIKITQYNSRNQKVCDEIFLYDQDGRLLKQSFVSTNGYSGTTAEYEYDGQGRMIRETHYSSSGRLEYSREYTYDEKGNLIDDGSRQYTYNDAGQILTETNGDEHRENRYDENGNLIEVLLKNKEGEVLRLYQYTYTAVTVSPHRAEKLLSLYTE